MISEFIFKIAGIAHGYKVEPDAQSFCRVLSLADVLSAARITFAHEKGHASE